MNVKFSDKYVYIGGVSYKYFRDIPIKILKEINQFDLESIYIFFNIADRRKQNEKDYSNYNSASYFNFVNSDTKTI